MGMFDTFGNSQLKAGDCTLAQYKVGDNVPLKDGVYPGSNNFIIVKDGKFIAELEHMYDYFGEFPLTSDYVGDFYHKLTEGNDLVREHPDDK